MINNEDLINLDLDLIKNNVPNFSSEKLCEMIVCHRYLGFSKEAAIICMNELSKRRQNGDSFDFENHIEKCMGDLPPLNFSNLNLREVLQQAIKLK